MILSKKCMVTCGIPIANHYSGLKMAFITLTNSCSTVGPITYPNPNPSRSPPSVQTRYQSFVIRSFGNQKWIFCCLRWALLCLLFCSPVFDSCQSAFVKWLWLPGTVGPAAPWAFLLCHDKVYLPLTTYIYMVQKGGPESSLTSCQIFWHIIWICASSELPFPAGHLSGPNALHDKRKHCFPIPSEICAAQPPMINRFPSSSVLIVVDAADAEVDAEALKEPRPQGRRCHKLCLSQLSSTERKL